MPVTVLPLCPVACGALLVRIGDELRAVIVVKASFALAHERSAWPIEPDPLLASDEHVGGHPASSLDAASDLAPHLVGAGVVLRGAAYAPTGRSVTEMTVRLAVFQEGSAVLDKRLTVFGDRPRPDAAPASFTRMPIVYERAYGGPSVAENPVGMGAGRGAQPNIVDPRAPKHPAGFAPISRSWAPRTAAMRAFDAAPREGDVVVLPASTDFRAFSAAPVDQRLEEIGDDAWIVLDGLHKDLPRLQSQLPFARAEARFARAGKHPHVGEVALFADTLTIDAERLVASIVWRGHLVVGSAEEASALRIYAGLELPSVPIRWPAGLTRDKPAMQPLLAPGSTPLMAFEATWPDIPDTTTRKDIRAIRAALAAEASGGAPGSKSEVRFGRESTRAVDLDQRKLRESLPSLVIRESPGPKRAPLAVTPHVAPAAASHSDVRAAAEACARARQPLVGLALAGADLSGCDLTGADLRGADLGDANLVGAKLAGADLSRATLTDADFSRADLSNAKLSAASGDGARFVGARAARATFARGTWDDADFGGANLEDADLAATSLERTRFTGARARGVRLVNARGPRATFEGAHLQGAKASGAVMPGATFDLAEAQESTWEGAELEDARFVGACLDKASFFRASTTSACFSGADLRGANLRHLGATGAELEAADLRGADLSDATFENANLDEATLRDAKAARANFTGASLRDADLTGADLAGAILPAV